MIYEWTNGHRLMVANFSDIKRHPWTVEECRHNGKTWIRTGRYKRFDTLDEVRTYVTSQLF